MRSLGDVARTLYGVTPAEFLDARGAEAAAALDHGDRTLATRIRSLRKPTVAAWAVNALVRERRDEVDAVLELGERMRAATADLDREALQALGRERQRLLAGIGRAAREVGDEAEVTVSEAAVGAVQTTFQAAVSDSTAAAAVRSGLLVRTLTADGIDPAELAGSMAVAVAALPPLSSDGSHAGDTDGNSGSAARSRTKPGAGSTTAPTRSGADDRARERAQEREQERERAREAARREADDAQQQADAAAAELAGLESRIRDNHDEHERLTGDLRRLRRELDELQDAVTEAKTAGAALRRERQAASRASEAAARAATRARQSLDRLP